MASNDIHDLTIIGAGPAGLFAAYYAGFRGLRTKLIDSQPDLGGQVTALYPDKLIYDVAGFPKILGKDLVTNLVAQAMQYQPTVQDRKSTRLNSSHVSISYAVFCLKKKKKKINTK